MERKKRRNDDLSFLDHLEELRRRIFYSLIPIIVIFFANWFIAKDLFNIIARPIVKYLPPGQKLAFTSLTTPFMLYLKISLLAAVFFASPIVAYQAWKFISPALYPHEKKYVIPFVFSTSFFFLLGGAFGYFIVFPWTCRFFLSLGKDFQPIITIDNYFNLAIEILLGIGIVFELPVVIFILSKLGILSPRFMIKNFKYAVLISFVVAGIITPTPDAITQSIVAGPFILLYSIGIFVSYLAGRKKDKDKVDTPQG